MLSNFTCSLSSRRRSFFYNLSLEILESREVLSCTTAPVLSAVPQHIMQLVGSGITSPLATAGPTGYTPTQVRHAYGFDSIAFNSGTIVGDGSGTTIAIVDAYDDPNIANDLKQFDAKFGLPDPVFTKVNQNGGTAYPSADAGWISEIALDVEWAHAIAPRANILLVEASDASFSNLLAAVNFARNATGVVAVSMSWGGGEFAGETSYDSYFTTPAGHGGVVFTASSGDSGAPAIFPAISSNVISVGGTSLYLGSSNNYSSESAWNGSGGGVSAYVLQPAYQKGLVSQSTVYRTNPDISYDSDPSTGFPVYDSYNNGISAPWSQFGGTSDAAPQIAALIAIADQGRALAGKAALDGASQALPIIYRAAASDFHDITTGSSGGAPAYSAGIGYDLATGKGTPLANLLVNDLIGQSTSPVSSSLNFSAPALATAGTSFLVTIKVLDQSGNTYSGYRGTVQFTSTDSLAGLPVNYTFTAADNGSHTFNVTLKTAGRQSVSVKDIANLNITSTSSIQISAGALNHYSFAQQPSNVAQGVVISPSVSVRLFDAFNNLLSGDNSDPVTISLGNNPSAATLSGTTTVTVVGGLATFSNLKIDKLGTSYTLLAKVGALSNIYSNAFSVISGATSGAAEDFEKSSIYNIINGSNPTAYLGSSAAHDGQMGLVDTNGNDWIYRNDPAATVKRGDTISVWLKFSGAPDGRAYFAFGSSTAGSLSLVAAANSKQLILMNDSGYGFSTISSASQTWQANHWYRMEVAWNINGTIVGRVFDSNGSTLLSSVTGSNSTITSGGFGFRATGSDKFWDTVNIQTGVNNLALPYNGNGSNVNIPANSGISNSRPDTTQQTLDAFLASYGCSPFIPSASSNNRGTDAFFAVFGSSKDGLGRI